jgi:hypothetical protein
MKPTAPRSLEDKRLHRLWISIEDVGQSARLLDEALIREQAGADPKKDTIHQGLVCAAVVYYARPFGNNEPPEWKSTFWNEHADRGLDWKAARDAISTGARKRLHKKIITLRNTIVAHAESRHFDVKMYRSDWPAAPPALKKDFTFRTKRLMPALDLVAMRISAREIAAYWTFETLFLGEIVKKQKNLRRLPKSRAKT